MAHKRIYLKQGNYVLLENILFAITAENYENIPDRIRRLLGRV